MMSLMIALTLYILTEPVYWWRRRSARRTASYPGAVRRYPVPAHRAHLYARAADEAF